MSLALYNLFKIKIGLGTGLLQEKFEDNHIGAKVWLDLSIDRIGPLWPSVMPGKSQSDYFGWRVTDYSAISLQALEVTTDGQQVASSGVGSTCTEVLLPYSTTPADSVRQWRGNITLLRTSELNHHNRMQSRVIPRSVFFVECFIFRRGNSRFYP